MMNNSTNLLTDEMRGLIDVDATSRANGGRFKYGPFRIKVKQGTYSKHLWDIRRYWILACTEVAKRTTGAPPGFPPLPPPNAVTAQILTAIDPTTIRIVVESAPWKVQHIKAVGRFIGIFKSNVEGGNSVTLKGEMGPPKSYVWTVPPSTDRRPLLIATFSEKSARWVVHPDTWQTMMASYGVTTTDAAFEVLVNQ